MTVHRQKLLINQWEIAVFYSTTTATPIDAHAAPALPMYGSGACSYSQARATVESVFSPETAGSVMARPGTLCIATVTVLVILAAAVQPGAVAYLEEVPWDPWNPLF